MTGLSVYIATNPIARSEFVARYMPRPGGGGHRVGGGGSEATGGRSEAAGARSEAAGAGSEAAGAESVGPQVSAATSR